MISDPGQTQNIATEHPEIVKNLRSDYESWWESISTDFADYCEIIIDTEKEDPVCLHSHDWHTKNTPPWNQNQVRAGLVDNGFWIIDVARKGTYEFTLRRWPVESGLAMKNTAPPGDPIPGGKPYPDGKGIHFVTAKIRIGNETIEQQINNEEMDVRFTFELEPGEKRLQTWLKDRAGVERGAYYVYVTKK